MLENASRPTRSDEDFEDFDETEVRSLLVVYREYIPGTGEDVLRNLVRGCFPKWTEEKVDSSLFLICTVAMRSKDNDDFLRRVYAKVKRVRVTRHKGNTSRDVFFEHRKGIYIAWPQIIPRGKPPHYPG